MRNGVTGTVSEATGDPLSAPAPPGSAAHNAAPLNKVAAAANHRLLPRRRRAPAIATPFAGSIFIDRIVAPEEWRPDATAAEPG
jgi:hypothetical protein